MAELRKGRPHCIDTLRLDPAKQARLLADLARAAQNSTALSEHRRDERVAYRHDTALVVHLHQPGGTVVSYLVRARNLSRTGVAFLHGTFVYPGSRCTVSLLSVNNQSVRVDGVVVRCQHVQRHVHDIGVRFDEPIRMRDFVARSLLLRSDADTSAPLPQLSGHVLSLEASPADQELLAFHLRNLGIRSHSAPIDRGVLDLVSRHSYDVVLIGLDFPDGDIALGLVKSLRASGYNGPIIALSADETTASRAQAIDRGCTCLLVKPYTFETLANTLARHMPRGRSGPADLLYSELWNDNRMRPLIRAYLARLDQQVREMARLLEAGRADTDFRRLCLEVKGSAGGYGFPLITQAAATLLNSAGEAAVQRLREDHDNLAALCRSALAAVGPTPRAAASPDVPRERTLHRASDAA